LNRALLASLLSVLGLLTSPGGARAAQDANADPLAHAPAPQLQQGHSDVVNTIMVTADGEVMIIGSQDATIRVRRVREGTRTVLKVTVAKGASVPGKPADATPRVVPELGPGGPAALLARFKRHWARQGFKLQPDGATTDGWPNTLIGPGSRPFHRTPAGIYLPAGYQASDKAEIDGYPQKLTRDDGKVFIRIASDQFKMGCLNEKIVPADDPTLPAHLVGLSGFYIQETEVTNGEMESYLSSAGDNLCEDWRSRFLRRSTDDGDDFARNLPAICISWNIASAYAEKRGGKLPTEAQWEFAARSRGEDYTYVWDYKTSRADRLSNRVNINNPSGRTGKVASYAGDVTVQGVHDMAGNVREWCRDVWKRYAAGNGDQPAVDPEFPLDRDPSHAENNRMVIRGGAFNDPINLGKTTQRDDSKSPDYEEPSIGFRIVIECPEATPPAH
jgi:formylglycine-generating enzyme required for sulfatase activity